MPTIHLLTPGGDLRQCTVVCGARLPERGTWDPRAVTCPACQQRGQAFTTRGPGRSLSEKAWLQQVRTLAHTHNWTTYHTLRSQGSEPGFPDLVLLKGQVLRFVELKVPGGRVTPAQQRWLEGLRHVDQVHAHLWYPEDWDTILEVLR